MGTKIYFLSDMHLGAGTLKDPMSNERKLVRFLDSIKEEAKAIYLLGDVIDYWFEFGYVVPRGFTRFLGKLGELTDRGIEVHWFTGNHDIWIFDYLPQETGVIVHHQAEIVQLNGQPFYLAHGDGLGDDNTGYKLMSGFFHSPFIQKMFRWIHPDLSTRFAYWWSKKSRLDGMKFPEFLGEDKEHLVVFAKKYLKEHEGTMNFIFGHRHIMLDLMLSRESRLMILGDWIAHFSYVVLDGDDLYMDQFEPEEVQEEERCGISIAF